MLKFWRRAKEVVEKEIDSYSQILTQRDPYYETFLPEPIAYEETQDKTEDLCQPAGSS